MKYILLSADSEPSVYLVPDDAANHLIELCLEFIGEVYRLENNREFEIIDNEHSPSEREEAVSYDETGFIYWLNQKKYPNEHAVFVETVHLYAMNDKLPEKFKEYPWFNF